MNNKSLIVIARKIKKIGQEVQKHLGCGFNEVIFQNALSIEFRNNNIEYLQEVNVEIFYKGEHVGVDRPDFIITKVGSFKKPIILELKVTDKISDNFRIQLKSYCTSLPRNNNPVFYDFAGGILMSFPQCDMDAGATVKTFVTDSKFHLLIDDQAEEERLVEAGKEKKIKNKS